MSKLTIELGVHISVPVTFTLIPICFADLLAFMRCSATIFP